MTVPDVGPVARAVHDDLMAGVDQPVEERLDDVGMLHGCLKVGTRR
jgi:hypothetical protein